jgi:hypothetical protein
VVPHPGVHPSAPQFGAPRNPPSDSGTLLSAFGLLGDNFTSLLASHGVFLEDDDPAQLVPGKSFSKTSLKPSISVDPPPPPEEDAVGVKFLLTKAALTSSTAHQALMKIFLQMGLPEADLFGSFLQRAGVPPPLVKMGKDISNNSPVRAYLRKPPHKPICAIPRNTEFNSTLRMDFFFFEKHAICHFTDAFSRFSAGSVLSNRSGESTASCLLEAWLSVHGPPSVLIGDLGGEFTGGVLQDLCDHYDVDLRPVPTDAHYAHGVVEVRHHIICGMMERLRLEFPKAQVLTLFLMSVLANNMLHSNKGWSPFQLVRGRNPPLPSLRDLSTTETPGGSAAESVKVLHRARELFLGVEAREIIKRALSHNQRTRGDVRVGDVVDYYLDDGVKHSLKDWRGPGKLIGIEGNTTYIRHGMRVQHSTPRCTRHHVSLRDPDDPIHPPPPMVGLPPPITPVPSPVAPSVEPPLPTPPVRFSVPIEPPPRKSAVPPEVVDTCSPIIQDPLERDRTDWSVVSEQFIPINDRYGPFHFSAYNDELKKNLHPQIPMGYNKNQDGSVQLWRDRHVWANPPFDRANIEKCLKHALSEFAAAPLTSRFVGIFPLRFENVFPLLVDQFQILKIYPSGTMLFEAQGGVRMKPCHFPCMLLGLGNFNEPPKEATPSPAPPAPPPLQQSTPPPSIGNSGVQRTKFLHRIQHLARKTSGRDDGGLVSLLCAHSSAPTQLPLDTTAFITSARLRKRKEVRGPEAKTPRFVEAKEVELRALETYKVHETVPLTRDMDVYCSRFVLNDKKGLIPGGPRRAKARLVVQNHTEQGSTHGANKVDLQCFAPTTSRGAFKLILCLMLHHGWLPKTIDVRTAFLQGKPLRRKVYVRPPPEAGLPRDQVWLLLQALYGLVEAPDRWFAMVYEIFVHFLGGKQSKVDPAVFWWSNKAGELIGLCSTHVDDFCFGGTAAWLDTFETGLRSKVDAGVVEDLLELGTITYAGIDITLTTADGKPALQLDLNSYIEGLTPITIDAKRLPSDSMTPEELTGYRALNGGMMWAGTQLRPTECFMVSELASHVGAPLVQHLHQANECLAIMQSNPYHITLRTLTGPLKMVVHTDASWGNVGDGNSQGGEFISLAEDRDDSTLFCPVLWTSRRIRRAVRSTFGAETLSLVDGVDNALVLRYLCDEVAGHILQSPVNSRSLPIDMVVTKGDTFPGIPLQAVVDCKSVFDHLGGNKTQVTEKRLMVDLANLKEDLHRGALREVCWCVTTNQLADCLTKKMSGKSLIRAIESGTMPNYAMTVRSGRAGGKPNTIRDLRPHAC